MSVTKQQQEEESGFISHVNIKTLKDALTSHKMRVEAHSKRASS